jgi:hypothetical protein
MVALSPVASGLLAVLREACEGGVPGEGTAFLDGTRDGVNNGLFATLDRLTAEQASDASVLGLSVAAHAAHTAYHMEVVVRWESGDRGPFDWAGSFAPAQVDNAQWAATRMRARTAYEALVAYIGEAPEWDADTTAGFVGATAHVAYHLGAIRQAVKKIV